MSNDYVLLLLAGVAVLHVGAFLVKFAWFPRRTGGTPHCRNCDYIVDKIEGDRCPECGRHLSARTIVRGERVRRPRLGWLGVFLIVVGVGAAALSLNERFRAFDWYRHKPARWVISDLKSSDAALHDRAWAEIERRRDARELSDADHEALDAALADVIQRRADVFLGRQMDYLAARFDKLKPGPRDATLDRLLAEARGRSYISGTLAQAHLGELEFLGQLSAAEIDRLTVAGLEAQAAPSARTFATDWLVDGVARRAAAGKLTGAQRDQFFEQCMPPTLVVRPDVIAGESIPYWVRFNGYPPKTDDGWHAGERIVSVAIDDEKPVGQGGSGTSSGLNVGSFGSSARVKTPGDHVLHVVIDVSAYRGAEFPERETPPFWRKRHRLSASFKALPAGTSDYIKLRDEPDLADRIRRAIQITRLRSEPTGLDRLAMNVTVTKVPTNVAFDVIARHGGKEYVVGTLAVAAGEGTNTGVNNQDFPGVPVGTKLDVVLRSSTAAARRTVELYEIWKGEVLYPGLVVEKSR